MGDVLVTTNDSFYLLTLPALTCGRKQKEQIGSLFRLHIQAKEFPQVY